MKFWHGGNVFNEKLVNNEVLAKWIFFTVNVTIVMKDEEKDLTENCKL